MKENYYEKSIISEEFLNFLKEHKAYNIISSTSTDTHDIIYYKNLSDNSFGILKKNKDDITFKITDSKITLDDISVLIQAAYGISLTSLVSEENNYGK